MNWGNSTSGSLRVGNEGAASRFEDVDGGAWGAQEQTGGWGRGLSNARSTEPIQRGEAGLTSDQRQPFPPALPATASPLTAPGTPQPSGLGTRTKDLQGAEKWAVSKGAGRGEYEPSQGRIPQTPLVKRKHYQVFNIQPTPQGPGGQMYWAGDRRPNEVAQERVMDQTLFVWNITVLNKTPGAGPPASSEVMREPQGTRETWALPLLNQASVCPLSIQFTPSRPQEARISS